MKKSGKFLSSFLLCTLAYSHLAWSQEAPQVAVQPQPSATSAPAVIATPPVSSPRVSLHFQTIRSEDTASDNAVNTRYIIPTAELRHLIQNLRVSVDRDENGVGHIKLDGWVPEACAEHLHFALGPNPEDPTHAFDETTNTYPVRIEGRAVVTRSGEEAVTRTPEDCFGQNSATQCSRRVGALRCVRLSEISKAQAIYNQGLDHDGNVVLRIENSDLSERTADQRFPGHGDIHFESATTIAAREHRAFVAERCQAARDGDVRAIQDLRNEGLVDLANRLAQDQERREQQALEEEFNNLVSQEVSGFVQAQRKLNNIVAFANRHREFRNRAGSYLMQFATSIMDDERFAPGEDDSVGRFEDVRFTLVTQIYNKALELGIREARVARVRASLRQLRNAAVESDVNRGRYSRIFSSTTRLCRDVTQRAQREAQRAQRRNSSNRNINSNNDSLVDLRDVEDGSFTAAAQDCNDTYFSRQYGGSINNLRYHSEMTTAYRNAMERYNSAYSGFGNNNFGNFNGSFNPMSYNYSYSSPMGYNPMMGMGMMGGMNSMMSMNPMMGGMSMMPSMGFFGGMGM